MDPKPDRSTRLADALRKVVSPLLQDSAPLGAIVTLTHLDTDERGMFARIYITVLPENKEEEVLLSLTEEIPHFRQSIAHTLDLRGVPEIKFIIDRGEKTRERIE